MSGYERPRKEHRDAQAHLHEIILSEQQRINRIMAEQDADQERAEADYRERLEDIRRDEMRPDETDDANSLAEEDDWERSRDDDERFMGRRN